MHLIALKGPAGCGKSTLGRALSEQLGWPLIDKIECRCSDEWIWSQRIDTRKDLGLPGHHQTDWDAFKRLLPEMLAEGNYPITHPLLEIDTVKPSQECILEVVDWIEQLMKSS